MIAVYLVRSSIYQNIELLYYKVLFTFDIVYILNSIHLVVSQVLVIYRIVYILNTYLVRSIYLVVS